MNDAETDWQTRIHDVMQSDDRLTAAHAHIRQQTALLAVANATQTRAINQMAEANRLLQATRRKTAYLARQIQELK